MYTCTVLSVLYMYMYSAVQYMYYELYTCVVRSTALYICWSASLDFVSYFPSSCRQ